LEIRHSNSCHFSLLLVGLRGQGGHSWSRLVKVTTQFFRLALEREFMRKILAMKFLQMKTKEAEGERN
jgi:hypothetical protein